MKKKVISALMATVMAAGLLVGCGGKDSNDASSETAKNADGSTEISIWVHETDSPEGQLYKKLIDDFNKENEGKYHATLTQIARSGDAGGYDDKINAAISNGGLPDVFTIDGVRVGEFADAGAIVPLGEYYTEDDLADFNPSIIQQGTYKDELYTVGCFDSSVGIFYNKDMFEKAGITPATKEDPWTLEELTDAAKKLTTDDCYGITMSLDATDETVIYFFLPLIQSQGSNVIADDGVTAKGYLNGDAALNTVSWIKDMVDNGYASATPEENSFELGKAAMAINGSWAPAGLADYDINWGLMPMAKYDEESEAASACGSWTFGMSKDCPDEKKEAAAELIKFMTSTDADAQMYGANSMPPARQSAFDQIDAFKEAPLDVFQYQLANTAQARPVSVNYAVLSNQFATAVQNVLTGMDPKEALDEAVTQYNFQTDTE
ncbi:MAG: extracellular solute-binding protein [Lachnospiraceae bacterium]|nr:ABC transporter substrate-binding protein [Lachnospiraceae bacterium]MDY4770453.1 ABC transporter substrate-binding protein [Lachnospiraceae bacterium]